MSGNPSENRIGAITQRVRVPGDAAAMYERYIGHMQKPSASDIQLAQQVANTDPYMARGNIFAFGTSGLNEWSNGTSFLGKQYDDDGNMFQMRQVCIA